MIELKDSEPIFIGGTRYCFIHPEHPNRCIKVLRPDRTGQVRRLQLQYTHWKRLRPARFLDDQLKEISAYRELQKKIKSHLWKHVPEYFGTVNTDIGLGIVTRLFRNTDGSLPANLNQLLPLGMTKELSHAITTFTDWLYDEVVITRDLLPHNIIAVKQQDNSYQCIIVDGIGDAHFIPLSTWFIWIGRQKIQRKIIKFHSRIKTLPPSC